MEESIDINEDDKVLVYSLKLVMAFGSSISFIFFIFELLWKWISEKLDRISLKRQKSKKRKNIRKIKVQCRNTMV